MKTLTEKIHELPPEFQREVEDFVDFLLQTRVDEWYWSEEGQKAIRQSLQEYREGKSIGPFSSAQKALKALKKARA